MKYFKMFQLVISAAALIGVAQAQEAPRALDRQELQRRLDELRTNLDSLRGATRCHADVAPAPAPAVAPVNAPTMLGGRFTRSLSVDFCAQPYDTICGARDQAELARHTRISANLNRVETEALSEVQRRFFYEATSDLPFGSGPDVQARKAAYYRALRNQMRAEEQASTYALVQREFTSIKNIMLANVRADAGFDETTKARMVARINSIRLVNPFDLLDQVASGHGEARAISAFEQTCGERGASDNAYLDPAGNPANPPMVVCPGMLFALQDADGGPDSLAHAAFRLALTLGHEMGHSVDSVAFPSRFLHASPYGDFQSCLDDHYLAGPIDGKIREISADYWGDGVVAAKLAALPANQRRQLLRDSFELFCGMGSDTTHPEGRIRIAAILASNPGIHRIMGCTAGDLYGKPLCSASGANWNR